MTQMDLFQVAGTTFRFPPLPPEDYDTAVRNRRHEQREKVLTAARKVKREQTAWRPAREVHVKAGGGTFTPKLGEPGSVITLADGRDAEVWSDAPGSRCVWALLADGTCVRVSLRHNSVIRTWKWESQVRAERIARAADKDNRCRSMAYEALRDAGADYREHNFERARAWALSWISHEMFPELYPKPNPFEIGGKS